MAEPGGEGLRLRGLRLEAGGRILVKDVDLDVPLGRVVALVGASGSGKTLTARACLGLLPAGVEVLAGQVELRSAGEQVELDLGHPSPPALGRLRGRLLGWLPQGDSLDPTWTIGRQLRTAGAGEVDVLQLLTEVGLPDPARVARLHPHALSGGMARRASLALLLARGAKVLLVDEPTTGLDPLAQREVVGALAAMRARGHGVLFITHDLRLLPDFADEVLIIDDGALVDRIEGADISAARSVAGRRLVAAVARAWGRP